MTLLTIILISISSFALLCLLLWKFILNEYWKGKVAVIFGFRTKELEATRWQFFPFDMRKKLEDSAHGLNFEQSSNWLQEKDSKASHMLIISFAGAALRVGGVPRREFRRTLWNQEFSKSSDLLFLVDPDQSFYLMGKDKKWTSGTNWMNERLKNLTSQYDLVISIGASMGANAALYYSHFADSVVCFAPLSDFTHDESRFWFRIGIKRVPLSIRQNYVKDLKNSIAKRSHTIDIHIGTDKDDEAHVAPLKDLPNVHIWTHSDCPDHKVANKLKATGQLEGILQDHIVASKKQVLGGLN